MSYTSTYQSHISPVLKQPREYDVAIVGGGLAGLALAIQLAKQKRNVILLEKERYPFHKVCGEYISMESWDFLTGLGLNLEELGVARINRLQVSAPNGQLLEQELHPGGFGISRYTLDNALAAILRSYNIVVRENAKVNDIRFDDPIFVVEAAQHSCVAKTVCAAYGKRSNLDIKWKRPFTLADKSKLNNYIGVKYHVTGRFPADTISLHTFSNGYCGLVKIEEERYCLCYLTTARNLQECQSSIAAMESKILHRNPHLKKIFNGSVSAYEQPLTISQISFDAKEQVRGHVLMIGDAAGMITPLCGNGMSMALRGSKIAAGLLDRFLSGRISRAELEHSYAREWNAAFESRLRMGRRIQRLLRNRRLTSLLIRLAGPFPGLIRFIIRKTHGEPF